MPETKLPTRVPLPEVSSYTEDITFGALGLPQGFDQSSLIVSLRSFDRIRKVAGLDTINIFAASGATEPLDAGISSVDAQGTATIGLAAKRKKKPLVSGSVNFGDLELSELFSRPDAAIKVDNTELETRIEEGGKYQKGVADPKARAIFLNRAVKRGLSEASHSASFNPAKLVWSGLSFSVSAGLALPATNFADRLPLNVMLGSLFTETLTVFSFGVINSGLHGGKPTDYIKHARYSLFFGITPDRYVATAGLLAASKLIRARA